jgi:hypothetical protein
MEEEKIFVLYFGCLGLSDDDMYDAVEKLQTLFNQKFGIVYIIPDFLSQKTELKCINPCYITEKELVSESKKNLKELNKKINTILNEK